MTVLFLTLLRILALFGVACGLGRLLRVRPDRALAGALPLAGLILYPFALAGFFPLGSMALIVLGTVGLGVHGWSLTKSRRENAGGELSEELFSPGCVAFLLVLLLYAAAYGGQTLTQWDEYSNWGPKAKELMVFGGYAARPNALPGYPFGSNLLQAFFANGTDRPEGMWYLGQFALLWVGIAPFLAGIPWRKGWRVLPILLGGYLAVMTLGCGLFSLWVDHLVGALFGGALAAWFLSGGGKRGIGLVLPILAFLPLVKQSGTFFALAAAAVVACDEGIRTWRRFSAAGSDPCPFVPGGKSRCGGTVIAGEVFPESPGTSGRGTRRISPRLGTGLLLLALFLAPILAAKSFDVAMAAHKVVSGWSFGRISVQDLSRALSNRASDRERTVRERYARALVLGRISNSRDDQSEQFVRIDRFRGARGMSWVLWSLVVCALGGLAAAVHPARVDRVRVGAATILLLGSAWVYVGILLLAYLFLYGEWEAVRLASLPRYLQTPLLGILIPLFALILSPLSEAAEVRRGEGGGGVAPQAERTDRKHPRRRAAREEGATIRERRGLGRGSWAPSSLRFTGALFALVCLACLEIPSRGTLTYLVRHPAPAISGRIQLQPLLRAVESAVSPEERVFIVAQHETGFWKNLVGYELFPRPWGGGSIGEPWGADDIWTRRLSPSELSKELGGYDWLLVVIPNDDLYGRYGSLFARGTQPKSDFLYKIGEIGSAGVSGDIRLTPVRFR
jgi:hypothetical protein